MLILQYFMLLSFVAVHFVHSRAVNTQHLLSGVKQLENLDSINEYQNKRIVNKYVDENFIPDLNKYIKAINKDPVPLDPLTMKIKVLAIVASGSLSEGWLKGLSTIKRQKSVDVTGIYPNFKFTIPITLSNLRGGYHYSGEASGIKLFGDSDGTSTDAKIKLSVYFNPTTFKFEFDNFTVQSPGKVNVNFNGNFGGNIPNVLVDAYFPLVKPLLSSTLHEHLEDAIEKLIDIHNEHNACNLANTC